MKNEDQITNGGPSLWMKDSAVLPFLALGWHCAEWSSSRLSGAEICGGQHTRLAISAFDQCHEYNLSILELIEKNYIGSAYSLIRPCFEALARGIWLLRIANDAQVNLYIQGRDTKKVENLLQEIKRKPELSEDLFLVESWEKSEKTLHGFTHISFQLLARRLDHDLIESGAAPTSSEIADAIRFSSTTAMLATVEIAKIAADTEAENEALIRLNLLQSPYSDPLEPIKLIKRLISREKSLKAAKLPI